MSERTTRDKFGSTLRVGDTVQVGNDPSILTVAQISTFCGADDIRVQGPGTGNGVWCDPLEVVKI